ncbi:MAG: hypothetical protein LUE08_07040 [Akkermansiaceae bacterium]|nr:hypothetical protein [Akkermansiaceae bacterium]
MIKNALSLDWALDEIGDPAFGGIGWAYRPTPAERAQHDPAGAWEEEWIPSFRRIDGPGESRPFWRASRQTSDRWQDTIWEPGWREEGDYLIYDGGKEN